MHGMRETGGVTGRQRVKIAIWHVGTKKSPSNNGLEVYFSKGEIEETDELCTKERFGDN
jgi:hypothetical protein